MNHSAALALLVGMLATACTGDADPSASSGRPETPQATTPSAAASTSARSPEATQALETAPFSADTSPDVEQFTGGPLSVTAVRVARQSGFDRVVFELDGEQEGAPGWRVEYVDDPRRDGSGDPVEVEGDATLVVLIDGVGYPQDTGREEAGDVELPSDLRVLRDVELGAVFEGTYEAFLGTARQAPFRVFRLADPARVVVDVRHD